MPHLVANVDGQQEKPTAGQHAKELGNRGSNVLSVEMDDRVERDDSVPLAIPRVKGQHALDLELDRWVAAPRYLHHRRGKIDAHRSDSKRFEITRDMTRSAPDVRDQPISRRQLVDERTQKRSIERLMRQLVRKTFGVGIGHSVIRLTYCVVLRDHAGNSTNA